MKCVLLMAGDLFLLALTAQAAEWTNLGVTVNAHDQSSIWIFPAVAEVSTNRWDNRIFEGDIGGTNGLYAYFTRRIPSIW